MNINEQTLSRNLKASQPRGGPQAHVHMQMQGVIFKCTFFPAKKTGVLG